MLHGSGAAPTSHVRTKHIKLPTDRNKFIMYRYAPKCTWAQVSELDLQY